MLRRNDTGQKSTANSKLEVRSSNEELGKKESWRFVLTWKLERDRRFRRENAEEVAQLRGILLRKWRKLKQHWPELRTERRRHIEQLPHIFIGARESFLMRDALRRFEDECECIRHLLSPLR